MSTRSPTTSTKPAPTVYVATLPLGLIKDTSGATHDVYDGKPVPEHAAPKDLERQRRRGGGDPEGAHHVDRPVYRLPR